MKNLYIEDYRGYSITFVEESGLYTLVLTDYVVAHLIMHVVYVVNEHPSVLELNKFKTLIDAYLLPR